MDTLRHNTVGRLCKVSLLHRYRISLALTGLRLYRGQPQILEYLLEHGDCSQKELADSLGVSPASIATSLKRMSKAGFIDRTPDEADRRINRLYLTDKGREVLFAGRKECDKVDGAMFEGFTKEEITAFSDMLERISKNLSGDGISEKDAINFIKNADNNRNGDDKND